MDARKLSKVLAVIGAILLILAAGWWFLSARDAISGTDISMGRFIRCLWSSGDGCDALRRLADRNGIVVYNPVIFWAGVVLTMLGLVIGQIAPGGGGDDRGRENSFVVIGRTIGWLFLALGIGFLCWAIIPVLQGDRFDPIVLGAVWKSIDAESLGALGPGIQRHIAPWLYTDVVLPVLTAPAYVDFLVFGAVLALLFRRRRGKTR